MDEMTRVWSKDDFLNSTEPYEELYRLINDKFALERALNQMSDVAKLVGVKNFRTLFKGYCQNQKMNRVSDYTLNVTNFDGQEMELDTGEWEADEHGITKFGQFGEVVACVHPIMPVQRLVNIDTGVEKLKLAYRKGRNWRHVVSDKKQLASSNSIIGLADYGIAVTSENARHLVTYLHDVENLNYENIPENNSVSRLGWIDGEGFSPYVDNLIFDGDLSFRQFFDSVKEKGKYEKWLDITKRIRQGGIPARILLAASFASALVEPCGGLPFFVHLWGGTETGKTVGLMLAASVWANPEMGKYIHTFNSTTVAQELAAGFVNSMPLILDELQIVKEKKDFDNMIYQLSEGVGRSRGQKTGGIQRTQTWNNCILTTGEQPISNNSSGGGAVNRIIEINCEDTRLFMDPVHTADTLKRNYGFAGKIFVTKLQEPGGMEMARELQSTTYRDLVQGETTEKQAMAAALILTADTLINKWIFQDGQELYYKDVIQFLSTKKDVSVNDRAFRWLTDWIAQNKSKFDDSSFSTDTWGRFELGNICVIRNVFDRACSENGFNSSSFLSWLKRNDLIETPEKGNTKMKRINGIPCHCVVLSLPGYHFEEE